MRWDPCRPLTSAASHLTCHAPQGEPDKYFPIPHITDLTAGWWIRVKPASLPEDDDLAQCFHFFTGSGKVQVAYYKLRRRLDGLLMTLEKGGHSAAPLELMTRNPLELDNIKPNLPDNSQSMKIPTLDGYLGLLEDETTTIWVDYMAIDHLRHIIHVKYIANKADGEDSDYGVPGWYGRFLKRDEMQELRFRVAPSYPDPKISVDKLMNR